MPALTLRVHTDSAQVTKRATQIVNELINAGHDIHDIARLTDTTVLSLLDGATPQLSRPQFEALATHFDVNRLWLWTGFGPKILDTKNSTQTK